MISKGGRHAITILFRLGRDGFPRLGIPRGIILTGNMDDIAPMTNFTCNIPLSSSPRGGRLQKHVFDHNLAPNYLTKTKLHMRQ